MEESQKSNRPEILAPAGSMESLRAAIAAGCDAVYMGGLRYGARAYADNPDERELLGAIDYCHRYGVRLYMTVNTLFKPQELDELYSFMLPYYQEGLDAVIVQDLGAMKLLHDCFPELAIHASTQLSLTMGESTSFLEDYGVTRLVPARELSLTELKQMRQATGLEMEVFVHGAYCYCYSGQCLFSSMLGDRSGNRGRCAQPCRKSYQLEGQGEKQYYLSPRENCALSYFGDLMELGVDSFKIEGRMKRPEYVALTTAIYRKYRDVYLEKKEKEEPFAINERELREELRELQELYNRQGFTAGYLSADLSDKNRKKLTENMMAMKRPNHGGVLVGRVKRVFSSEVEYLLQKKLHRGDVVEFRNQAERTVYEYTLGEDREEGCVVRARYQKGCRIRPGDPVYRTKAAKLLELIRSRYLEREAELPVDMRLKAALGQPLELEVNVELRDGRRETATVYGEKCQPSLKHPAIKSEIKKLLKQTGGTSYVVRGLELALDDGLFLPVGAVKKLRREALARLQELSERKAIRKLAGDLQARKEFPEMLKREETGTAGEGQQTEEEPGCSISVLYAWQARQALESSAVDRIYLRMERMSAEQLLTLLEEGQRRQKEMYLELPAILRAQDFERLCRPPFQMLWSADGLSGVIIQNMESLVLVRRELELPPERIITGAGLYVMNHMAAAFWADQGISQHTLPYELSGREMPERKVLHRMEAIIYGRIPLMVSAQCLIRNTTGCLSDTVVKRRIPKASVPDYLLMKDDRGRRFDVFHACRYCYNIIYQDVPLSLAAKKQEMEKRGIRRFRINLSFENQEEVRRILQGDYPKGQTGHFDRPVL